MSKIDFIHLLPSHFPYGAHGMLSELHYALDKYHSDEVNQEIVCLKDKPEPEWFCGKTKHVNREKLADWAKRKKTNPVFFLHKLSATDCSKVSTVIYGKVPFVIINHTSCDTCKGLARSNCIVAVSKTMQKSIKNQRKGARVDFIVNGVNACRYEGIEPYKLEDVKDYFVTGRMNNFNGCKHPQDWIPWIKSSRFSKPLWHDYLGDGAHFKRANLQAKNTKRNTGNIVNLTGRINDFKTKVGFIKRWDAFLYDIPGKEGTSMSLLESLACGVPAVINDKPGNNEIIVKNVNGYVYKSKEKAIDFINNMIKDPKYHADLCSSTRDHFEKKLDAKHMAKKYLDLAKELSSNG